MAIEVAAWNINEGLAKVDDPQRPPKLVEAITGLDKDVVVLSDAYWLDNPLHETKLEVAQQALETFERGGYEVIQAEYDDEGSWPGCYETVLSRVPLISGKAVHLGGRGAVQLELQDPATNIGVQLFGVHFSDHSEGYRLHQVAGLLEAADLSRPTVLAGDLNAMPGNSIQARWLRSRLMRAIAARVPDKPGRNEAERRLGRPNQLERLSRMATGTTLEQLEKAGLHNSNYRNKSTMHARFPFVQLDHILATADVSKRNFQVHDAAGLSDHLPISVMLET